MKQEIPEQVIGRSELTSDGRKGGSEQYPPPGLASTEQGVLFLTLLVSTLLGSSQASQTSTLSVCAALGCFGSACLPAHSPFSLLSPAFSLLLIPCGFAAH